MLAICFRARPASSIEPQPVCDCADERIIGALEIINLQLYSFSFLICFTEIMTLQLLVGAEYTKSIKQ